MNNHVQMYYSLLESIADYSEECLEVLEPSAGDLPQWTNDIISRTRAWMKDVTHFLRGQENRGVRYGNAYHGRAYMATKNLREIHEYAKEALSLLSSGAGILPAWVEKKISVCEEYMDLVGHWLENEYVEGRRYGSYLAPVPGDAGDEALYRGRADGITGDYKNPYSPNSFKHGVYDQGFHEGYGTKERRYGARGGGRGALGGGGQGGRAGARGGARGGARSGGRRGGGAGRGGRADRRRSGRGPGHGARHRRHRHHRHHPHGGHIYPYYTLPYYYLEPYYEPVPVVLETPAQTIIPTISKVSARIQNGQGFIEIHGSGLSIIGGIGIAYHLNPSRGHQGSPISHQVQIIGHTDDVLTFIIPEPEARLSDFTMTDIAYFAYNQSNSWSAAFFAAAPYPFTPFANGRRRYGAETTSRPTGGGGRTPDGSGGRRREPTASTGTKRGPTVSIGIQRGPSSGISVQETPSSSIIGQPKIPGFSISVPPGSYIPPSPPIEVQENLQPSDMTQFMPPNRMLENHRSTLYHRQLGQDTGRRFGVPGFVAGEPGWAGNAGVAQSPHPTRRMRSEPPDPTFGPGLSAGQGGVEAFAGASGPRGVQTYGSMGYGSMGDGSMDMAVRGARFSSTRKRPKKGKMFRTRKGKKR